MVRRPLSRDEKPNRSGDPFDKSTSDRTNRSGDLFGRSTSDRTNRSSDPFDRISNDKDSGKYGRSSFGQREASSNPRNSSFVRDRSSDSSYSSRSEGASYSRGSSSSGGSARSYDPIMSESNGGPSRYMSSDYDYLYSPNVVLSALKNDLRTPHTLYYLRTITQNRKRLLADPVAECIRAAQAAGVKVVKTTKHELNEMAQQRPHQGIVLEASKLPEVYVKGLGPVSVDNEYTLDGKTRNRTFVGRKDEPPVWIALDEVVDPQNLGAILRTAFFMGVDGVVVCHKNSAPLSAVVAKASAGALEVRPTYGVQSLMKFIQASQKNGWHVVGAHVTYGSKRNRPWHTWPSTGVEQPTLLIMGNEGNGLRKQIMGQCDSFIQIPCLSTTESNVDSLNVSVATGIILSKLMGGRFLSLPKNLKKFPLRALRGQESATAEDRDGQDEDDDTGDNDDDEDTGNDDDDDDDDQDEDVEVDEDDSASQGKGAKGSSKTEQPMPW
ncbi:hypothetical protein BGZ54_009267 [Gamsiella multidivaricata]|nr:hypothetical protein BGZ54_009267 [Gamsiella multidivaricata]